MLVLTARPGVALEFTLDDGQTIKVFIVRQTKKKVQLGLRMPDAVRVQRIIEGEGAKKGSSR